MDAAAKRIQAAYRGHSVRQDLNWRLPSGRTLADKIHGVRNRSSVPNFEEMQSSVVLPSSEGLKRSAPRTATKISIDRFSDVSSLSEESGSTASLLEAARNVQKRSRSDYSRTKRQTSPVYKPQVSLIIGLFADNEIFSSSYRMTCLSF